MQNRRPGMPTPALALVLAGAVREREVLHTHVDGRRRRLGHAVAA
jgi:hypothetical protein